MSALIVGKKYKNTNPIPFPIDMLNATITITLHGSDDGCSVAYDYVKAGKGSMSAEHAEKNLELID